VRALDELQNKISPEGASTAGIARSGSGIRAPRPLHVLTLTPFYPSSEDEVRGCFVAETLRAIELCGIKSSVIAVDAIYHPRKHAYRHAPAEWIRYPQLPGNFGLSTAGSFLGVWLLNRVRAIHRRAPIDVIHAHAALPCGHAAAFLSWKLTIPFVITVHGLDVFNNCFENGKAAAWRRAASMGVYKRASNVICISKKIQQMISEETGDTFATSVVYNGTDTEVFAPSSDAGQSQTLLIVGNLLRGKGQEVVLRAMTRLKKSYPSLQCKIIGEGAHREHFESLAKQLCLSDRVHFLGRKTRAEVAAAMRECTVFVLPSRFEGLGCVYLEAMACGKPVIGCHGQGIAEIIEHGVNGWLIPVDGLDELVSGLDFLLTDSRRRQQIGEAARRTIVNGLTLSQQAASSIAIYKQVAR
jgi:teichuronic acid biosynthesis glycosyltransferase TuaC